MEGKSKDEEEMQDCVVVEENMIIKFPLFSLPLVSYPCSSCFKIISAKKELNNHMVEMPNGPSYGAS